MMDRLQKLDRSHGPLQIVHDFQFVALNVRDDYSMLDGMEYEQKRIEIQKRIDRLHDRFYSGLVLNVDFKNYLQNEESFRLVSESVDYARNLGMRVWLYDEQYYPSGSAGGLTLRDHPELEGIGLVCISKEFQVEGSAIRIPSPHGHSELKYGIAMPIVDGQVQFDRRINVSDKKDLAGGLCWNADDGQWRVYAFFVRVMYELTYLPHSLRASRRYPNILDEKAIERFVDLTFRQGYEKYLGTPLGEKIQAVFTDEPSLLPYRMPKEYRKKTRFPSISVYDQPDNSIPAYPYIPWLEDMPERFQKQYGYDLIMHLPDLFEDTDKAVRVRTDLYKLVSAQVEKAYLGTMCGYLEKQGVAMSGHYNCEEAPTWHPHMYGDILRHLGQMDIPGCDLLGSDAAKLRYSVACKVASSAAHIYGRDRAMIEASNMMDKDQSIDLKKITTAIALMFAHGVNEITSYYSENVLPEGDLKQFCRMTARLGSIFEGGTYKVDTLVFYPFEEICGMAVAEGFREKNGDELDIIRMDKTCKTLWAKQICFDMINLEKARECKVELTGFFTGYGERIRNVVVPELPWVAEETAEFLRKARDAGAKIWFCGERREIGNLGFEPEFLEETVPSPTGLGLKNQDPLINVMCREFEECNLYLMVNSEDREKTLQFSIPDAGGCVEAMDPLTGAEWNLEPKQNGGRLELEIKLSAMSSVILAQKKA